jgi:hypothetical protein
MNLWEEHGDVLPDALLEARIGRHIDKGSCRTVYVYEEDEGFVVKHATTAIPSDNVIEWSVWRLIRKTSLAQSFGRIVAVSESGRLLVMERLDSITLSDYAMTPAVPAWLADVKPAAFGRSSSGLLKVRDYGSLKLDSANLIRKHWQRD